MKNPLLINGVEVPDPLGPHICDFCRDEEQKHTEFDNWNDLSIHITIVHNSKGRTRDFYNGKPDDEILNHPDWTGFVD